MSQVFGPGRIFRESYFTAFNTFCLCKFIHDFDNVEHSGDGGHAEVAVEIHAGVIFVFSKTFAKNDSDGIAVALVRLDQSRKSGDWKNRIFFLTKGVVC